MTMLPHLGFQFGPKKICHDKIDFEDLSRNWNETNPYL